MNRKISKYLLLSTIIVLGTINAPNKIVGAEESSVQDNVQTQSGITIDKSNFDKYFTINGSANYDKQSGELILTPDLGGQAGSATSKTQIDVTKDFSISMSVNIGSKTQREAGGDGIAIGLYNDIPGKIGTGGNSFGLGSLNEAFGFKLDTAFNDSDAADFRADPLEFQDMMTKNYAFGAFVSNEEGYITTIDNSGEIINRPNDSYRDLTLSYSSNSKKISVNYDSRTWSYNVGGEFSNDHLSLIISAGTGLACNRHSVIVHSLDATMDSKPVTVKYIDENQNSIAADKMLIDTLNAPYDVTSDEYKIPISGYVLDDTKLPNNATGTFTNSEQIVTYIYKFDQSTLNVKDSTIYRGDNWKPQDNFVSATDVDGKNVDFNQLKVDASKVDTGKAGVYEVTYSYDDMTRTVKVTVKDKQTAVNVHDSNLYVGDTWKAEDNFDSALDKDGNSVDFTSLTVDDSKVDTNTVGVYEVTYTYDGVTSTAKVTVIAKNGGDVTVKYENEQGKEIHAPQTIKGRPLGEAYDASTAQYNLDIKGYKHKEVQGNVTGTFTDQPQTVTYIYSEGLLQFVDVPQTMSFEDSKISGKTVEVKRKEADWTIKVEDTRLNKTNWRVSAKLVDSFKDSTGEETKARVLLYRDSNQSDQWLDNSSEVNVFDGVSTDNKDYYDVSWSEQSGPLLSIAPGAVKADQYKGEIQWNLLDTPL